MLQEQLPMFKQKFSGKTASVQTIEPVAPTGESSVTQTLPAFLAYLRSGYSESTVEKYFADVKKFSVFIREKKLAEITTHDLQDWVGIMVSPDGEHLDKKTINRKVSAIVNYFTWLENLKALPHNPAVHIVN